MRHLAGEQHQRHSHHLVTVDDDPGLASTGRLNDQMELGIEFAEACLFFGFLLAESDMVPVVVASTARDAVQ